MSSRKNACVGGLNPLSVKKDNYVINPDLSFVFNVGNTAVTTVERPETR